MFKTSQKNAQRRVDKGQRAFPGPKPLSRSSVIVPRGASTLRPGNCNSVYTKFKPIICGTIGKTANFYRILETLFTPCFDKLTLTVT
jgi:hypothetical protein